MRRETGKRSHEGGKRTGDPLPSFMQRVVNTLTD